MSIVIVVSAPPDRCAYRCADARSAARSAESAIWRLLREGRRVNVIVQAEDLRVERELRAYFRDLIAAEAELLRRRARSHGGAAV